MLWLFKDKEFLSGKKFDKFQNIILSKFVFEKFNLRRKLLKYLMLKIY